MRVVLFEPGWRGHQAPWIRALLSHLERFPGLDLHIVAPPELRDRLSVRLPPTTPAAFHFDAQVSAKPYRAVREWVPRLGADHLLLFELTPWERFLARSRLPYPLTGILFVQYPEIDWSAAEGLERVRRWLRRRVKEARTARWLRRQRWGRVFLLQGRRAADYLNRRFPECPVFAPLPDPVPGDEPGPEDRAPEKGTLPPAAAPEFAAARAPLRLVHVGVLSARKGMEAVLRALENISPEWAAQCTLEVWGQVEENYRGRWQGALARLRRRRPDVNVQWRDGELDEGDFRATIRRADWLLLPYLRTEYSSGLLGYAAVYRVPVIGPTDGLLGHLIREYGLGITTRTDPQSLRVTLERIRQVSSPIDESGLLRYIRDNDARRFAEALLEAARGPIREWDAVVRTPRV